MSRWSRLILVNTIAFFIAFGFVGQIVIPFLDVQQTHIQYVILFIGVTAALQSIHWFVEQTTGYTLRDLMPDDKSPKELEKEWSKGLKRKNLKELRDNLKTLYDQKRYDWVISYANRLMELRPNDIDAYQYGGNALNELERSEEALEFGQKLAGLHKLNYAGYSIMGRAYSDLGESEKSIENYERALILAPDGIKIGIQKNLAREYAKVGEVGKALTASEIWAEEYPSEYNSKDLERLKEIQSILGDRITSSTVVE